MVEAPSPKAFLRAFGSHWADYMSGAPSVPAAIAALYVENRTAQFLLWITAAFSIVLVAYLMWRRERIAVISLSERFIPKLVARFDPERGITHELEKYDEYVGVSAYGEPSYRPRYRKAKYLRLSLEATGEAVARNCEVFLDCLHKKTVSQQDFQEIKLSHPIALRDELFDVKPKIATMIDFAKANETGGLQSTTPNWPNALGNIFSDQAIYRLSLRVHASEITSSPIVVEIAWNGKWNEIIAHQVQAGEV